MSANIPSSSQHEPGPVEASFLASLEKSAHQTSPFDFWLLEDVLPQGFAADIANLPFDPPADTVFNGRRETNNATRVYFTPENQARFDVCEQLVAGFKSPRVMAAIERETGTNLNGSKLRIEYCQDCEGFWLEPHTDIAAKKYTMLVYLTDNPALAGAGTDIHEGPPEYTYVTSAPYARNKGVIFIPGENTWHAVGKRAMKDVRKSIIINYVDNSWRDTWELA